ncbi:hypothetical protein LguiB_008638 [Lonicera macranthoides]
MSLFNVGNTGNSISNYIARRDEQSSSWWSQVSYDQVRGCIFKLDNLFSVLTGDIRVNRRLSKLPMIMFYNSEMVIKTGISLTSMVENNDVCVAKSKSRVVTLQSTAIQRVLPITSYEFFEADYGGSGACLSTVCKVSAANNELTEADKGGSEAMSSSDRLESEGNDTPLKVLIRDKHFSKSSNSQRVVCRESGNNKDWVGLNEIEKLKYSKLLEEMGVNMIATSCSETGNKKKRMNEKNMKDYPPENGGTQFGLCFLGYYSFLGGHWWQLQVAASAKDEEDYPLLREALRHLAVLTALAHAACPFSDTMVGQGARSLLGELCLPSSVNPYFENSLPGWKSYWSKL